MSANTKKSILNLLSDDTIAREEMKEEKHDVVEALAEMEPEMQKAEERTEPEEDNQGDEGDLGQIPEMEDMEKVQNQRIEEEKEAVPIREEEIEEQFQGSPQEELQTSLPGNNLPD